jgi:hypothetical protein
MQFFNVLGKKCYRYHAAAGMIFSKTYRAAAAMTFSKTCRDRATMDISDTIMYESSVIVKHFILIVYDSEDISVI